MPDLLVPLTSGVPEFAVMEAHFHLSPLIEPIGRKPFLKKWIDQKPMHSKPEGKRDTHRFEDTYHFLFHMLEQENLELAYRFRYTVEATGQAPFVRRQDQLNRALKRAGNKAFEPLERLLDEIQLELGLDYEFPVPAKSISSPLVSKKASRDRFSEDRIMSIPPGAALPRFAQSESDLTPVDWSDSLVEPSSIFDGAVDPINKPFAVNRAFENITSLPPDNKGGPDVTTGLIEDRPGVNISEIMKETSFSLNTTKPHFRTRPTISFAEHEDRLNRLNQPDHLNTLQHRSQTGATAVIATRSVAEINPTNETIQAGIEASGKKELSVAEDSEASKSAEDRLGMGVPSITTSGISFPVNNLKGSAMPFSADNPVAGSLTYKTGNSHLTAEQEESHSAVTDPGLEGLPTPDLEPKIFPEISRKHNGSFRERMHIPADDFTAELQEKSWFQSTKLPLHTPNEPSTSGSLLGEQGMKNSAAPNHTNLETKQPLPVVNGSIPKLQTAESIRQYTASKSGIISGDTEIVENSALTETRDGAGLVSGIDENRTKANGFYFNRNWQASIDQRGRHREAEVIDIRKPVGVETDSNSAYPNLPERGERQHLFAKTFTPGPTKPPEQTKVTNSDKPGHTNPEIHYDAGVFKLPAKAVRHQSAKNTSVEQSLTLQSQKAGDPREVSNWVSRVPNSGLLSAKKQEVIKRIEQHKDPINSNFTDKCDLPKKNNTLPKPPPLYNFKFDIKRPALKRWIPKYRSNTALVITKECIQRRSATIHKHSHFLTGSAAWHFFQAQAIKPFYRDSTALVIQRDCIQSRIENIKLPTRHALESAPADQETFNDLTIGITYSENRSLEEGHSDPPVTAATPDNESDQASHWRLRHELYRKSLNRLYQRDGTLFDYLSGKIVLDADEKYRIEQWMRAQQNTYSRYRKWRNTVKSPKINVRQVESKKKQPFIPLKDSNRKWRFLDSPKISVRTSSEYLVKQALPVVKKINSWRKSVANQSDDKSSQS